MASHDRDNVSGEKALINWKKWLHLRRSQHRNLGASLNRSPASLVMNSAEDVRYIIEEKEILERSQKLIIPDKYRGHPDFWRTPLLLPERPGVEQCEVRISKLERGLPLEPLERIGCPHGIKVEKNITGELRVTSKGKWERSEYVATRKKALRELTDGDNAFSPKLEQLMIQGHSMKATASLKSKAYDDTVTIVSVETEVETIEDVVFSADRCYFEDCFCNTRCIPKMKVQGLLLQLKPQTCCEKASFHFPHLSPKERRYEIRLILNKAVNRKEERLIRLENMASVKLEFSWALKKKSLTASRAVFFFNKNNDTILPGHIIHFPIVFHSRYPGVFIEEWQIKTSPALLGDAEIIICLWGKADADDYQELEEMAEVESYLHQRLAQTAARETADEILHRSTFSEFFTSRNDTISLFTEKDTFEEINPGFHYHPSVVESLKAMYIEICGTESAEWDLNLMKFRQKIVETSAEMEERQKRLEEFNNKVKKLLIAPQIQNLDLNTMKYDLGKGIFGHFPCIIEEQNHRLKECLGIKEPDSTNRPESVTNEDVKDNVASALPEDTEAAANQDIDDKPLLPDQFTEAEHYEDTLYKTLYQHLAANIEQLAANIESIHMCNIENK